MKYEFYSVTYSWALRPSKDDENYQEYIKEVRDVNE